MVGVLTGFASGFLVAASPGPIGFLCIRRSLTQGRLAGLVSGFGAAVADAVYAALAAVGVGSVMHLILSHKTALQLIGGILLIALGIHMTRAHQRDLSANAEKPRNLVSDFFSMFGLTIANPQTVLTFLAFFTILRLNPHAGPVAAIELVGGVLAGSFAWWLLICVAIGWLRHHLDTPMIKRVYVIAGIVVIATGLYTLLQAYLDRALH